jgi:hypothetical protein
MVTLLVSIRVIDFIQWKRVFDNNEKIRQKFNINIIAVYANVNDVDQIVIHLEAQCKEQFEDFTKSLPRESIEIGEDALLEPMKVEYLVRIN